MKESRHPHPHIDPRQPRNGTSPGTNPPVFAWKPGSSQESVDLWISRDSTFADVHTEVKGLADPLFLPEKAFPEGTWFWKWGREGEESEVFSFSVDGDAVELEVPPAADWLEAFSGGHPRIYARSEAVGAWRTSIRETAPSVVDEVLSAAGAALRECHTIEEPPYLPDRRLDYEAFRRVWAPIMWDSRTFVKGAKLLGLAYLVTGERTFARAACERMASISLWDPDGSSHLSHNDEAHMSVIWDGSIACDWVWDEFTDEERETVIAQFRKRGRITFEHMHGRGSYGVTRFDSHAGREIVFLALIALVFHEEIPEAEEWLSWLRPVLCGVWPVWAEDDGAWAEGPSYGLAYVGIMTMLATALKLGGVVDLYKRPFWAGHARWRKWCFPPYAEWIGFGDHSERWRGTWERNADLVEIIAAMSGAHEFDGFIAELRREASLCASRFSTRPATINPQRLFLDVASGRNGMEAEEQDQVLKVFAGAGLAAVRSCMADPERETALLFRSSPFGAISHSHANNNDFALHVGGKILAMPTGYYAGYGSSHHANWVWHTKSHNCVTLSGAGQLMRSHESTGDVVNAFEDEYLAYFCGVADKSYSDRATRCRRHVLFLKKRHVFVLIDEFEAKPGISSALEWNIHSWAQFEVDDAARRFTLSREGRGGIGHVMHHTNGFFTAGEGWDPPPVALEPNPQWQMQYHLRFTPAGYAGRRVLGIVLAPVFADGIQTVVTTEREGAVEVARLGSDWVAVGEGAKIAFGSGTWDAMAIACLDGRTYGVSDAGVERLG